MVDPGGRQGVLLTCLLEPDTQQGLNLLLLQLPLLYEYSRSALGKKMAYWFSGKAGFLSRCHYYVFN